MKHRIFVSFAALVVLGVGLTAGCPARAADSSLPVFHAFGEKAGLVALMDDFMRLLLADERTKPFFENVDQQHVKDELVDQFCALLDGPCVYTGRGMKESHARFEIRRGDFNALVEDLQKAMDLHHVPFHAQNKLLQKLAPMHRDVETK